MLEKNPFSMVSKSLVSSVWVPVIRTRRPNSHTDWYPTLKYVQDVVMESSSWLSTEYLSQLSQRLTSVRDIFEEPYSLPIAGSLCDAFLPVLILPHQTYIVSAVNFNILNLLGHLIFFFKHFSSL